MWSDTSDTSPAAIAVLRFAFHVDGDAVNVWSPETVVSGPKAVDDHISLKADSVGGVYAVTKTKFTSAANPGTRLHKRSPAGVCAGCRPPRRGWIERCRRNCLRPST